MNFSENSRVWIYQSDRPFTATELSLLKKILGDFTSGWAAHGNALAAGFEIRYSRFIVLVVDESQAGATGCSIDKSVNLMRSIEQEFGVNLFDRFHIAYRSGGEVLSANRGGFEALVTGGSIGPETIVFNNMVQTVGELNTKWEVPFRESWHPRVFELPQTA